MNKQTDFSQACEQANMKNLPVTAEALAEDFQRYLNYHLGRTTGCTPHYVYEALAFSVRDRIMPSWRKTRQQTKQKDVRRAYYLSLEFLIGRALGNHLLNLEIDDASREAMQKFSIGLEEIESAEPDAGLGNGGLGRLAACFMDSCATLKLPVVGYGIRYEYGMFHQRIKNGYQVEEPDHWLHNDNPWEIVRPEHTQTIRFGGRIEKHSDGNGGEYSRWIDATKILAVPYDMPVSGYHNDTVNTLRLWKAAATDAFNLNEFNAGEYPEAVAAKNDAEHISMVLYPNDASENGKELRLRQQYFLASASLQDVVRLWEENQDNDFSRFAELNVFQMNDTHPTLAVAELMRILVDEKNLAWDQAWSITSQCMAYTNHTLLPEALERWPVKLFEKLLPRLLEIIYRINAEFMTLVARKWPGDSDRLRRMSIIEEGDYKQIRMAYLGIVGSYSVNGVAALHSHLLTEGLFRDFYELWPHKFNNKTNGVTPRRWIAHANPAMTALISEKIGSDWVSDLGQIEKLKTLANNSEFQKRWLAVKQQNKQRLADVIEQQCGVRFDTGSLFDIQVKRIHEYKRQLLNLLHVIHLYNRIKTGQTEGWVNRCVLIGGKAAPGYEMAKLIIKLCNNIADTIDKDPDIGDMLKLVFLPNYNVSSMEVIAPAADLSEQISTAGKEASGTGNMKFMMNGALTIGTYDGANIEIMDAVGQDNFFLFGLKADEVEELKKHYNPQSYIDQDPDLQAVMHLLESGQFNTSEPGIFNNIIGALKNPYDPWVTLADFRSFVDAQQEVE
ncbi:MAG: glycogen/starch/alpha-glucan phosphorylase, partial [Gammaproteobacteria bacterium]|nr:glycogen/starch/alpha-glucan phosphorylase [Gammaproteobacteria bacterium]